MQEDIQRLLASNRAEELGYDVWERYVLPPFFSALAIGHTTKPRIIVGGRGCGKTMLLRYLSHESTFSPKRQSIPKEELVHVGVYWRSDTQFASLMQHRGLVDDIWEAAFRHLAAVVLGIEILRSLESIANSSCAAISKDEVSSLDLGRLRAYQPGIPDRPTDLKAWLEDRLAEFETWANNVRALPAPLFLPGHDFVRRLIALIREQLPQISQAVFFVYVDEFENLAKYQQRIVNTWLKHSEPPLIFNLAMKRNGFKTYETDGSESLSAIHDYRIFDLEAFDLKRDFPVFAGEILLLRFKLGGVTVSAIDPDQLRDVGQLDARNHPDYARRVQDALRAMFPGLSEREMAAQVFADGTLSERLTARIEKALTRRNVSSASPSIYVNEQFPEASIVVPALLQRDSLDPGAILGELRKLTAGAENLFTGTADWIHNNFAGCYLQLFDGLGRPCPFYGGFETFCYMARGNLRHFLELCHKALSRADTANVSTATVIEIEKQSEAARQVSADLLPEIRSFGRHGNNLHSFVLRLGSLFSLSQQSPAQSEPERTHFGIQGGESELDDTVVSFLAEAVKWSVLFLEKGTKKKNVSEAEDVEYILNPIYAPYFHISYRKRRKLDLPAADIRILVCGDYPAVRQLLRDSRRKWRVDLVDAPLPLFAHLLDEAGE